MSVSVQPYSQRWPELFRQEAARLARALGPWLVGGVEHVGSTAVPGLAAKPVLDMMAPVGDLAAARAAVPVLAGLGYRHAEHRPLEALWFHAPLDEDLAARTHQLHITRPDSALWRERTVFRDALRADASLLREYQDLKAALASSGCDLRTYTNGKRDFVRRVLSMHGVVLG